jgi:ubiquinone/menaquinone biosynthesis C-methylase UbiE
MIMHNQASNSYVFDPEAPEEMARLMHLDQMTTRAMGGPLAGLPNLPEQAKVLDLACGPGCWVLDVAFARPDGEVAGVDISQVMIEYATTRARSQHLTNASFGTMDITQPLDFSDDTFDLVNARFLLAALYRMAWPSLLRECFRIVRPGGLIRLTEPVDGGVTNSAAFERLQALIAQAGQQMGYGFSIDGRSFGITHMLPRLLRQAGFAVMDVRGYAQEVSWEVEGAWADFHQNASVAYRLAQAVLVKQGLVTQEEAAGLYQQIQIDMHQTGFCGMWHWVSVIASKSAPRGGESRPYR